MSFFSWLFGFKQNTRRSNHGYSSKHNRSSKHGSDRDPYYRENTQQQYINVMKCQQCRSVVKISDKFCSECGLPL
ncbi:hypothetical protein MMK73_003999 [Providencia rettgeri]|uniref:hypothetical protein n=1 Tax=Providencia sp. TaxID=589 RepID=UPI0024AC5BF1|nr:hypothetical protein [Providencia rettgeri]